MLTKEQIRTRRSLYNQPKILNHGYTMVELFISIVVVILFIGTPFLTIASANNRATVINQQCNTNYSATDMLLNGDTIERLCQVKEQTVTIK